MNNVSYYSQSIVGLQSGKVLACELLIRRQLTVVQNSKPFSSNFFIDNLVELTNLKITAVKKIAEQRNVWVFMNFSRCEIANISFNLCSNQLSKLLAHTQIVIEVTECEAKHNEVIFEKNLANLKKHGFQIAIDDYGVGLSNIESLNSINPDFVKLDISLIQKATTSKANAIKFYRLVDLIRNRGHKVVIEGIETKEQLLIAKKTRAELAQGYLYHHPERIV